MIARKPLSVSLTPELHAFIGGLVETGSYASSSEVVRAGLRLLQQQQQQQQQIERAQRVTPQAIAMKVGR